MNSRLAAIIENTRQEVQEFLQDQAAIQPLRLILEQSTQSEQRFSKALSQTGLSVISEIKRSSPSVGAIAEIADPLQLAARYKKANASAISVLTEHKHFGGSIEDLQALANVPDQLPLLRKDFIVDPIQIAQAKQAGASAILLIVAVLQDDLKYFLSCVEKTGLEALVEVHDRNELDIALQAEATIIGVNNRNLKDFTVSLSTAQELATHIPSDVIKVAESGIKNANDAQLMAASGYDAILVGEALVRSDDPVKLIAAMKSGDE